MPKKKLLLHTCCAPCACYPLEILISEYDITCFYYNPNITDKKEYNIRFEELKNYTKKVNFDVAEGIYDRQNWVKQIRPLRYSGEKGERCWLCYALRLEETFKFALKNNFDLVTTALSISPHKNAEKINQIGKNLSLKYGIEFMEANFKKNNGFKRSTEISRENNFYRQNYCGCLYSQLEREKDSLFFQKSLQLKLTAN